MWKSPSPPRHSDSAGTSPKTPKGQGLNELRKLMSAPFSRSYSTGSPHSYSNQSPQQQHDVAVRVPDALTFFFPPQVYADPSADIDALTVIGGRAEAIPPNMERWFVARQEAVDVFAPQDYDVDKVLSIGNPGTRGRIKPKGFDIDMLSTELAQDGEEERGSKTAPTTTPITAGQSPVPQKKLRKRRSSFPPHLHDAAAEAALLVLLKKKGANIILDESEDDEEQEQNFLLLGGRSTKDIDEIMDSEPAEREVMERINSVKTREKVKEVLHDVDDHIKNPATPRKQVLHPKVDVDQLILNGSSGAINAASAADNQVSSNAQQNVIKRDIDYFLKLAEDMTTRVTKVHAAVVESSVKRDIEELVDLADKMPSSPPRSKSITFLYSPRSTTTAAFSKIDPSAKKCKSESNMCVLVDENKFEPARNAALVKDVLIKAIDVDGMIASAGA
ncbi:hypothetical protein HDU98_001130 [Podochytrium sp. JEL0797]|nr:hypothetical protein HDU98_001130 [Podochytrium sp. JEL0797]